MWFWISFLIVGMAVYLPLGIFIWCFMILPIKSSLEAKGKDSASEAVGTIGVLIMIILALLVHGGFFGWYKKDEGKRPNEVETVETKDTEMEEKILEQTEQEKKEQEAREAEKKAREEQEAEKRRAEEKAEQDKREAEKKSETKSTSGGCMHYEYGQCWDELEEKAYDDGSMDAYFGGHGYYEGCSGVCEDIYEDAYYEGYWDYGGEDY